MTTAAIKAIDAIQGKPANNGTASRMTLKSIVRGKLDRPVRALLYGTEKVGKSTWAANAPDPVFLCSEDGTANLDVARLPEPRTFAEVLEAIQMLNVEPHDYKTLVIDTVDWLEPLVFTKVLEDAGKVGQGIESVGYGKGYTAAVDLWRVLLSKLDALRADRKMHVILLGHAWVKAFNNPQGENFDRYTLKMNDKAAGVIKEWVDAVLFANYEILTHKADKLSKAKGVGDGARIVHTQKRDAFDAGNRYNLPETIPLSWDEFWSGVRANTDRAAKMRADIDGMIPSLGEKDAAKARAGLAAIGDNEEKLAQMLDWAAAKING